jgi:hypothetical protein
MQLFFVGHDGHQQFVDSPTYMLPPTATATASATTTATAAALRSRPFARAGAAAGFYRQGQGLT